MSARKKRDFADLRPSVHSFRRVQAAAEAKVAPIFVDELITCMPNARWKWNTACHLYCNPGDEAALHAMASRIGLKRAWYQTGAAMPHYDLNESSRARAIRYGAMPADRKHVAACIKRWREATELADACPKCGGKWKDWSRDGVKGRACENGCVSQYT